MEGQAHEGGVAGPMLKFQSFVVGQGQDQNKRQHGDQDNDQDKSVGRNVAGLERDCGGASGGDCRCNGKGHRRKGEPGRGEGLVKRAQAGGAAKGAVAERGLVHDAQE